MSEVPETLLIDAGNTNVKFCLAGANETLRKLEVANSEAGGLLQQHRPGKVILASVRGADYSSYIEELCLTQGIAFQQVVTSSEAFGVRCAYTQYQTLGIDRWLNILAVAHYHHSDALIVSIGTAMTVDYLSGQQHKGGWIVPGYDLAKSALFNQTAQVFGDQCYPDNHHFGESTEQCVNFGCRAVLNGLLQEAVRMSEKTANELNIYISGGGKQLIDTRCFKNIVLDDLLVFRGMSRFI